MNKYNDAKKSIREHYINKKSSLIDGIASFVVIVGSFILGGSSIGIFSLIILPFYLSEFIVINLAKIRKPWVKYFVITTECLLALYICIIFGMKPMLIAVIPVIRSMVYFKPFPCFYSSIMVIFLMAIAHIKPMYKLLTKFNSSSLLYTDSVLYGFVPLVVSVGLIIGMFVFLIRINSKGQFLQNNTEIENIDKVSADNLQKAGIYELLKILASVSSTGSNENSDHSERVYLYMYTMLKAKGLSDSAAENIAIASVPYDLGKIKVSNAILNKPGKLTADEFREIKLHTSYGRELLSGSENDVVKLSAILANEHHERWDGRGYIGLKENEVNEYSYYLSIIDTFEALTSTRSYRNALSIEEAYNEIVRGRGSQFAPFAVDLFKSCFSEIESIYDEKNQVSLNAERRRLAFLSKVLRE